MGITGTSILFNMGSSNRMQMYLESSIIMDYLEFLQKIELLTLNEAFLECNEGVLRVNIE